eukprot:COSAG01_NODE_21962_length_877_cov_2.718509_1_plen_134_part_01
MQEDASVVQAFVHAAYQGSWSMDTAVETSSWWGLELGAVEHPPVADGEVCSITLDVMARDSLSVKTGSHAVDAVHWWVGREAVMEFIAGSLSPPTHPESVRFCEWIKASPDDRFIVIFDGQNHVSRIDRDGHEA